MQFRFNTCTTCFALSASMLALLAACGGGGGSDSAPPAASNTTTGVAAIGAPIVGGNVAMKCASGATASATTDSNGAWGVVLKNSDYPCVARVNGGTADGQPLPAPLHSVAQTTGTTNITPVTDLITGILGGQNPATWYDNAKNGDLSGAITASGLSTALDKLKIALATLPGKPVLPNGFDPLTSKFDARKGDAGDDLLESYGSALQAAGLTQADATTHTVAGQALTQTASVMTVYTTPNMTAAFGFRGGASTNLDGTTVLSLPDPNRGALTAKVQSIDGDGNVTALTPNGPFVAFISALGNRVGQLCTAGTPQRSQYVYASDELTEVTDPAELQGKTFNEYENCDLTGTSVFNADGSFTFTETGKPADAPDANFKATFTAQGLEEVENGVSTITRAKAYKYTANGVTKYVYFVVATKKNSTTPALNDETDYVLMGMSH